jgi:hypothetical protein
MPIMAQVEVLSYDSARLPQERPAVFGQPSCSDPELIDARVQLLR